MNGFFNNYDINEAIKKYIEKAILYHGDYKYAYAIMNKKNPYDLTIICNYPSWCKIYLEESYQLIDPVILKALDTVGDFAWDEKILIYSEMQLKKIFKSGYIYNVSSGHTFVLHDNKNNLAVLSLFKTVHSEEFCNFVNANKAFLQYLLITTHQKMLSLYQDLEGERLHRKVLITERENQILYWTSIGKTYAEIAIILGISLRTVKFHMRNVVDKLGVLNAKHAIKLAAELQIIRPLF